MQWKPLICFCLHVNVYLMATSSVMHCPIVVTVSIYYSLSVMKNNIVYTFNINDLFIVLHVMSCHVFDMNCI